jgi:hypothetical protein
MPAGYVNTNHLNPELNTAMTACPIPPSDVELAAVKQTADRLAQDEASSADRVQKIVADASALRAMHDQAPEPNVSPESIALAKAVLHRRS